MIISPKLPYIALILLSAILIGLPVWIWNTSRMSSNDERIARQHCGNCHSFPEPTLLNKHIWVESVIPKMAFRMGFPNYSIMSKISPADLSRVQKTLPTHPMITEDDLQAIIRYYWYNSPDELKLKEQKFENIQQFQASKVEFNQPFLTMLKVDTVSGNLFAGMQSSWLFSINKHLHISDSVLLRSPPSHALIEGNKINFSTLGVLMPNDEAKGTLTSMNLNHDQTVFIIDSLQRPVFFSKEDMNEDGAPDFIVCEYGNYTGYLALFEAKENLFVKHILSQTPGARKVVVLDFNNDGHKDIMALFAQGDERIILYTNLGNMQFEEKILLRFPPVYGSNFFEVIDFNKDGHPDILFTNGDNGDFSIILKPYHGIRLFINDGINNFKETLFFPMPGASQAVADDFDHDGDLDIAAISFFPDFDSNPERSFVYLENQDHNIFQPQSTPDTSNGRWLVMELWDYDDDGDTDIFLGASSYRGLGANNEIFQHWMKKATPLMVLTNNLF